MKGKERHHTAMLQMSIEEKEVDESILHFNLVLRKFGNVVGKFRSQEFSVRRNLCLLGMGLPYYPPACCHCLEAAHREHDFGSDAMMDFRVH